MLNREDAESPPICVTLDPGLRSGEDYDDVFRSILSDAKDAGLTRREVWVAWRVGIAAFTEMRSYTQDLPSSNGGNRNAQPDQKIP